MYRKPKDSKNWRWYEPATVIGREGGNYWASFAGRCHLIAPEHIRIATGEELGATFSDRATQEDLEKLLQQPFADEEIFAGDDQDDGEGDLELPPGDEDMVEDEPPGDDEATFPPVAKRYRTKGPQEVGDELFDELLVSTVSTDTKQPYTNYMMKLPKTPRARRKPSRRKFLGALYQRNSMKGSNRRRAPSTTSTSSAMLCCRCPWRFLQAT